MNLITKLPNKIKKKNPILFVHGAWHGAWCWEVYFMDYFVSKGYATYALDLSNHGKNKQSKSLNLTSFSDFVNDVHEAVTEIGSEPILIGHSMGGGVVLKYLEKYPAKAAVNLASLPISTGAQYATVRFAKRFPWAFLMGNLTMNLHRIVRTKEQVKWAFYGENISDADLQKHQRALQGESYLGFLEMLFFKVKINHHKKTPMFFIAGEKDNIFSVKELEHTAAHYNADLKVIKNAPHNLMLSSEWKEVANEIQRWLSKKL